MLWLVSLLLELRNLLPYSLDCYGPVRLVSPPIISRHVTNTETWGNLGTVPIPFGPPLA